MDCHALGLGALASALAAPAAAARPHFIDVRLVSASSAPKAGHTILLGLEMIPQPGWHGYWSNPGESGLAPIVRWSAPSGVRFGPLEHPAPTLMNLMGMTSYVHAGPHVLLTRMTLDRRLRTGTDLPITADVTLAACSDKLCVPEKAQLSLRLKVGSGLPSPQSRRLEAALMRVPRPIRSGSFSVQAGRIFLRLPPSTGLQPSRTRFFPDQNGYWDATRARVVSDSPLTLVSEAKGKPPRVVTGVVSDGSSAYRLSFGTRRGQ